MHPLLVRCHKVASIAALPKATIIELLSQIFRFTLLLHSSSCTFLHRLLLQMNTFFIYNVMHVVHVPDLKSFCRFVDHGEPPRRSELRCSTSTCCHLHPC
jgi:hypothetical protein